MPDFNDFDSLPYIRMCVKEVQRYALSVWVAREFASRDRRSFCSVFLQMAPSCYSGVPSLHY